MTNESYTVFEVVSSVHGSLYCGYSLDRANETFDDAHQELHPTFIGDNLALYQDGVPIRIFWGQVSPSVADKYSEIISKRIDPEFDRINHGPFEHPTCSCWPYAWNPILAQAQCPIHGEIKAK